jgi:hypothetical protein
MKKLLLLALFLPLLLGAEMPRIEPDDGSSLQQSRSPLFDHLAFPPVISLEMPQVSVNPLKPNYPKDPTFGDPRPYQETDPKCKSLLCY